MATEWTAPPTPVGNNVPSPRELVDTAKGLHGKALNNFLIDVVAQPAMNTRSAEVRRRALETYVLLCKEKEEPKFDVFVLEMLPLLLDMHMDGVVEVRKCAGNACTSLLQRKISHSLRYQIIPILTKHGLSDTAKWQTKKGALGMIETIAKKNPIDVDFSLPVLVPVVNSQIWDTQPKVAAAARKCLTAICGTCRNQDLDPFMPFLIEALIDPETVPNTVNRLAATTFVTDVEPPTLAIISPLLKRSLREEKKLPVLRNTVLVVDNMCTLVRKPQHAELFLEQISEGLNRVLSAFGDPDIQEVGKHAKTTLTTLAAELKANPELTTEQILQAVLKDLKSAMTTHNQQLNMWDEAFVKASVHVTRRIVDMTKAQKWKPKVWHKCIVPHISQFVDEEAAAKIAEQMMKIMQDRFAEIEEVEEEEKEEGIELCDCDFSLAYGALILLHETNMRLLKGKRYGLCGANGAGKSTLMRAIANGQVNGFPPPEELKTVFVEHDILADDSACTSVEFIVDSKQVKTNVTREETMAKLQSLGFTDDMINGKVVSLSGGWKMKLQLIRAMLANADILLLDEPTNHLDVDNVKWVENFMTSNDNITFLTVSHDSGFLDNVCTHVIHYELNKKLKFYRGNLSVFVEKRPEAKAYYDLGTTKLEMRFPKPGYLDGIKSKKKPILTVNDATFTYPGNTKPTLTNLTVGVCLSSRIAVLGANGAGKSTLIKLMTGETLPDSGVVWKHPALRFAYVAQHAFHHIEQHLETTPNLYIQWRFGGSGYDKELLEKESRKMTEADVAFMKRGIRGATGDVRFFEQFIGRHKLKRNYEYEVKWKGLRHDKNTWYSREKLELMGFSKLLQEFDDRESVKSNLDYRQVSAAIIEEHLEDFSLDKEFGSHSKMKSLSGGQKVKVVLAAATWQQPHVIFFDEPTNYLDRDSLGALAAGINTFGGGIVLISHNREFTKNISQEEWLVEDGVVTKSGAIAVKDSAVSPVVKKGGKEVRGMKVKKLNRREQKELERKKELAKLKGKTLSEDEADGGQVRFEKNYGNIC